MNLSLSRCTWCGQDPLYMAYHDEEWGNPVRNRKKLFEMLILETMQAGLSWITVLRKREAMREAFLQFSPEHLAALTDDELAQRLTYPGIIRNGLKIKSVRTNAQAFLRIEQQQNCIAYFWQFTNGKILQNNHRSLATIPARTQESDAMAKQLKRDGFSFIGSTTCYALMQAIGMVNDHVQSCFRWHQLSMGKGL